MIPPRRLLALAPLLLLGGCVAAAIPVLAGSVLAKGRKQPETAPTPAPSLSPIVTVGPPEPEPEPESVRLVPVAAAPAPLAPEGNPYAAFARFAALHAAAPKRSALVDQDSLTATPSLLGCRNDPPAVVVDLDPGDGAFDPANPPRPAAGLAEQLAAIRGAGVTVLWAASTSVDRAQEVYTVLRASGLDPDRTDRLLLPRKADERKQTRRLAAGRDWCVIAVAGDRRGDFDEVFDYLRDPDGPIAAALAPAFGDGWFLVPTPIE